MEIQLKNSNVILSDYLIEGETVRCHTWVAEKDYYFDILLTSKRLAITRSGYIGSFCCRKIELISFLEQFNSDSEDGWGIGSVSIYFKLSDHEDYFINFDASRLEEAKAFYRALLKLWFEYN